MNQITRQPLFTGLLDLHKQIDRLFDPAFHNGTQWITNIASTNWMPTIDLKNEKTQYVIHADIPGVDPKDINVSMEHGVLTIQGHKQSRVNEERDNYVYVERTDGSFYRSVSLPEAVDSENISAKSKNGVLEIVVPKAKKGVVNKIKVHSEQ